MVKVDVQGSANESRASSSAVLAVAVKAFALGGGVEFGEKFFR